MKRLEISGRAATYDTDEQELMRRLVRRRDETGDPKVVNEIRVLHALKAEFGVNLVHDEVHE